MATKARPSLSVCLVIVLLVIVQAEQPADATEGRPGCASWNVRDECCPGACAAKNGPNWSKADAILRGCMRGIGCGAEESGRATVFSECTCASR